MTPLTSSEKQSRRTADLDAIAQAAGWETWTRYATAVKRGVVSVARNPAAQLRGEVMIESRSGDRPQGKLIGGIEMTTHNHSTRPNYRRVKGDKYEYYEPAIRGCEKCRAAATEKNRLLSEVAHDNFIKKSMNYR